MKYSLQSCSNDNSKSLSDNVANTTFVLLDCEMKMISSILEEIRLIPIVSEVEQVNGVYDIVIRLQTSSNTIDQTITDKIRDIKGIRTGITLHVIKSLSTVQKNRL